MACKCTKEIIRDMINARDALQSSRLDRNDINTPLEIWKFCESLFTKIIDHYKD